jgi:hypothetical protein
LQEFADIHGDKLYSDFCNVQAGKPVKLSHFTFSSVHNLALLRQASKDIYPVSRYVVAVRMIADPVQVQGRQ